MDQGVLLPVTTTEADVRMVSAQDCVFWLGMVTLSNVRVALLVSVQLRKDKVTSLNNMG